MLLKHHNFHSSPRQQEARKARGKLLFDQYKAKSNQVNAEAAATPTAAATECPIEAQIALAKKLFCTGMRMRADG